MLFPHVGIALEFASDLFKAWLVEKDMNSLGSALKRAGLETKLLVRTEQLLYTTISFMSFIQCSLLFGVFDSSYGDYFIMLSSQGAVLSLSK